MARITYTGDFLEPISTILNKVCPDCGRTYDKRVIFYGIYRDRYKDEKHPEGKLYVCERCYRGEKSS